MPLHLIHGPMNSGRTGLVLNRVRDAARRDPILVAPNADAQFALESELSRDRGAVLGINVTGPRGLAIAVLEATGGRAPQIAGPVERTALARRALGRAAPRMLARSATAPGFAAALDSLIAELRASLVAPDRATGDDPYLDELMSLYSAQRDEMRAAGLCDETDLYTQATTGLETNPDAWRARPTFLLGFDDLAPDQLGLVGKLAEACEVTVSITREDRAALR
ncbi:MAG TPA: hypothetical protein VFD37_03705, partial [Solirubrobacterales bacterium]|nr:hypothetical protein [Solirubrobacterales bacterium]